MAVIRFKAGDEYLVKLAKVDAALKEKIIGPSVYSGAGIVADEVRARLSKVPTDESWGTEKSLKKGPKEVELRSVMNGLGVSEMQNNDGFFNVKIGFGGYSSIKTKEWPQGRPRQMLARSIERGTSFMKANPFMKKAVATAQNKAIQAMKETADQNIEKIMKGK